jgi:hypothetical protein
MFELFRVRYINYLRPRDVVELPRKQTKSGVQADVTMGRS